jgi:two-component system, OmpR family, alkaline phosphatase synthesis response regulator PhoP
LILLDIMLPKKDGLSVLRELRTSPATRDIPVIFLTAKDSEIDEVVGLELGADDYIVKPISIHKLMARLKKALRKPAPAEGTTQAVLQFGDFIIDAEKYRVTAGQREVTLTKKEFEMLLYLARRPGRVISRRIFLEELWEDNVVVIDRTIDVHIRKIREKLGDNYMDLIETLKGVGYRFRSE